MSVGIGVYMSFSRNKGKPKTTEVTHTSNALKPKES